MSGLEICKIYEYEYEYDDQIVCAEVEKSLFEKKIEKYKGKATCVGWKSNPFA